jgi:hypothetical protein
MIKELFFSIVSFLGFALIMFEVPICCQFVQYTQPVAQFSEQRPAWQKAVLYSAFVNSKKISILLFFYVI